MIACIGLASELRNDWKNIVGDPKKPANWKDETFAAKLEELREKQADTAIERLDAAVISDIAILSEAGMSYHKPKTFIKCLDDNFLKGSILYGFDVTFGLRHIAWTVEGNVPAWMWEPNAAGFAGVYNLYSLCGAKGENLSLDNTLKFWVGDLEANFKSYVPAGTKVETCGVMAAAAATMAKKMGFKLW